ncbi:MAG: sporulation protein YqfD [Clostridia bacterium]|nr:sporulation protein YqfD [Clostridia bacterium]
MKIRFENRVTVRIEGLNQNRLLAEIMKSSLAVTDIEKQNPRTVRMTVAKKDLRTLTEKAENLGFTVAAERYTGFAAMLKSMVPRLAAVITLVACIALYAFSQTLVWRVEISGNSKVDSVVIERLLAQNGAKSGAKKSTLDARMLESVLRGHEGIAEASIHVKGTALKVFVAESLEPDDGANATRKYITADYDAEITRITVRSGTALVKVGQRVLKGTPLISGDIIGTGGDVVKEGNADGEVYGKVVIKESIAVMLRGERAVRSGRIKRSTVLSIFGLKIGKRSDKFEIADTEQAVACLAPLPIKVTTVTAYELVKQPYEITKDEAEAQAESIVRARMAERFTGEILGEKLILKNPLDGVVTAELYITAEILLGET